jgi:hypothetical protein
MVLDCPDAIDAGFALGAGAEGAVHVTVTAAVLLFAGLPLQELDTCTQ